MSHHRTKRQFAGASSDPSQRQITTFFTSSTTTTSSSSSPAPKTSFLPAVPPTVQSSLINVGMRVRKSVPEGYKTGSPHSAFKLWEEKPEPAVVVPAAYVPPRVAGAARELAPFCGVHSVGGFGVQPATGSLLDQADEEDLGFPGLTSSQETVDSVDFEESRKRGYEEDEDEVEVEGAMWSGNFMSPGSHGSRAVATVKGSRKGGAVGVQQGNASMVIDFEDADFLDERVFGRDN